MTAFSYFWCEGWNTTQYGLPSVQGGIQNFVFHWGSKCNVTLVLFSGCLRWFELNLETTSSVKEGTDGFFFLITWTYFSHVYIALLDVCTHALKFQLSWWLKFNDMCLDYCDSVKSISRGGLVLLLRWRLECLQTECHSIQMQMLCCWTRFKCALSCFQPNANLNDIQGLKCFWDADFYVPVPAPSRNF